MVKHNAHQVRLLVFENFLQQLANYGLILVEHTTNITIALANGLFIGLSMVSQRDDQATTVIVNFGHGQAHIWYLFWPVW